VPLPHQAQQHYPLTDFLGNIKAYSLLIGLRLRIQPQF